MVNAWWSSDESQRFWMEITGRRDVGVDLNAPQRDGTGNESWTYTLVTATRPGDVVFHWHTDWFETSALIGWSEIVGPLETIDPYTWQSRGTRGRARGAPTVGRGWRMPCANFTELDQPIDSRRVVDLREPLLALGDNLKRRHGTAYFPFSRYGAGIRAAQAYLTKFPAELIEIFPELRSAMIGSTPPPPSTRPRAGAGRLQDPALRKAIEEHAVDLARSHYRAAGATRIDVLGKPYDLLVQMPDGERHIEVKGSSIPLERVLLTANEVAHARSFDSTDLFVVDDIGWDHDRYGNYRTSGGRQRVWHSWVPEDQHLDAIQYQYSLTSGTSQERSEPC